MVFQDLALWPNLSVMDAVDLRYGTLVDVARSVHAGEVVDLRAPRVNALIPCRTSGIGNAAT